LDHSGYGQPDVERTMPALNHLNGTRMTTDRPTHGGQRLGGGSQVRHAQLTARLRSAGQRVTPQRLVILGAFRPGEHLSADEVFERVERELPAMTRSTVYRSLESFRDAGLISETDLGYGVRQFELLGEARHHHLLCHACGAMIDLPDELIEPLRLAIDDRFGFDAGIEHLAIFGYCAECRTESSVERRENDE
jgi:Fur family ferric uptake transcriptional regulator